MGNARVCWDWKYLVERFPRRHHYEAFFALWDDLLPMLKASPFPEGDEWTFVGGVWPSRRGPSGLFEQYRNLMTRVRSYATRCKRHGDGLPWFVPQEWVVRPVVTHSVLQASLARRLAQSKVSPAHIARILAKVAAFAGLTLPSDTPPCLSRSFLVKCESVAQLGYGRQLLRSRGRGKEYAFRGGAGDVASIAAKPFKGKIVQIIESRSQLDGDAVLATLEAEPFFAKPDEAGNHAWHAVRACHRTRLMRGRDATCERFGSLLHFLFHPNPMEPRRHVSRLFIRESGLGRDPTDNAIADEIASHLRVDLGRDAHCKRPKKRASVDAALDATDGETLRKGLRRAPHLGVTREECRPTLLRANAEGVVRNAISRVLNGGRSQIAPLPRFAEDVRTVRRNRATSVLKDAFQAWLSSEPAQEWRSQRKRLFEPSVSAVSGPQAP
jgi:hypothetical protein